MVSQNPKLKFRTGNRAKQEFHITSIPGSSELSSGSQTAVVPFQGWLVQLKYLSQAERKHKSFR
jgi:hypothetical protein